MFTIRSGRSPYWVEINGRTAPLSLQAKPHRKGPYVERLRAAMAQSTDFTFLCDVKIEIDWYIDAWERYEGNKVADIDNIVKPIRDAISGIDGVMVDDGQVQAIDVRWIDKLGIEAGFRVRIDALSAEDIAYERAGLRFAEISSAECYPVPGNFTPEQAAAWVSAFSNAAKRRRELAAQGWSKYELWRLHHIQRPFPTSRLKANGYTPVPCEQFFTATPSDIIEG